VPAPHHGTGVLRVDAHPISPVEYTPFVRFMLSLVKILVGTAELSQHGRHVKKAGEIGDASPHGFMLLCVEITMVIFLA